MYLARYLKLCILLIASVFFMQRTWSDIRIAATEKAPTPLNVDRWNQYQGQQWVEVEGLLAVDRAVIMDATDKYNRAKGSVYAYVPGPVHAVAVIGPIPGYSVRQALDHRAGPAVIKGMLAPAGVYDTARLFPGQQLDPKAVFVNEGTAPVGGTGSYVLFFFAFALTAFCILIISRDIIQWRRSRPHTRPFTQVSD